MATHFISLDAISAREFEDLLAVATYLKKRRAQGISEHALAGRNLAMIFEKPSLRTRLSFEVAMSELGGRSLYVRGEEVGMNSREPARDVARVLGRYVQGIMARVFHHQTVVDLARHSGVPVINGLCDRHHPCQALADFLTIREHFGTSAGLRVVFIGDANNVCRSLAQACIHSGSRFVLACPLGYGFTEADKKELGSAWGEQVTEVNDCAKAAAGAHVLYTDVWTSMGQEAERDRRLKAFQGYQISEELLARALPECRIMHCLPAHRGEEITDGAVEHPRSIIFDQAENRLHAQKAVLRLLLADDAAKVISAARS
ncbi:MAG: ornithine carbamoyltransferase [Planctomycetes bacterium]|nr:ornithine carbamoyltransferase [Planctomycetota bacterium]